MSRLAGRVILDRTVRADFPLTSYPEAKPGIYDVFANRYGALSLEVASGVFLGLKPGEFTWLEMELWLEEFWDGDKVR